MRTVPRLWNPAPERIRKPAGPRDEILVRCAVAGVRGAILEGFQVEDGAGTPISNANAMVAPADSGDRRWWRGPEL